MTSEEKYIKELRAIPMGSIEKRYYKGLIKEFLREIGYLEILERKINYMKLSVEDLDNIIKCFANNDNFIYAAGKSFERYFSRHPEENIDILKIVNAHFQGVLNMNILKIDDFTEITKNVAEVINSIEII